MLPPAELYGPWSIAGYDLRIDTADGVRLVAARDGKTLKGLPPAVRASEDMAWVRVALDAAAQHRRDLKALLERAMVEGIPLSADDVALMALDPVGRPMLEGLLLDVDGTIGRPVLAEWLLETVTGDLLRLGAPARVVHPCRLEAAGTLEHWNRWLNRGLARQPFKQIRRELYRPNAAERETGSYSGRFAGEVVRWDQARALLEGRCWRRVTKMNAERVFQRARLAAHLEFRTPASPGFSREQVVLSRVFFLPAGEVPNNRGNPGMPVTRVPEVVFSETLRDVDLVARVAGR